MALPTNYTELQTEVANFLARPGVDVTTFIGLAEKEMEKKMRVRQMAYRATAILNEEYEYLPSGFLDIEDVKLYKTENGTTSEARLRYKKQSQLTPEFLQSITASGSTPCFYTIIGSQIRFVPPPPFTNSPYSYQLHYYGKFTYLVDSVDGTNIILTNYPNIYLFGSLFYAAPFYGAEHRQPVWEKMFLSEIEYANKQQAEGATGTMAISMPTD